MKINIKDQTCFCEKCNTWITRYEFTFPEGHDGRVVCLGCFQPVGYTWDKEFLELEPDWNNEDL